MAHTDPRSDEALVQAANRGDPSAFEALYRRYRDWVVRLAWRFTGNEHEALDVLQETFAYLLRKLPELRLTARMTTFLYPVVKHIALGIVQKRRRYLSDDEVLRQQAAQLPQDPEASRAELSAALAFLPEGQLEVLLMRFVDDMTLQEIADALEIPLGTVKSRLHNALKTLRGHEKTRRYFEE